MVLVLLCVHLRRASPVRGLAIRQCVKAECEFAHLTHVSVACFSLDW